MIGHTAHREMPQLAICSNQAADIDIVFNAKKSSLVAVGMFDCNLLNLHLGSSDVVLGTCTCT